MERRYCRSDVSNFKWLGSRRSLIRPGRVRDRTPRAKGPGGVKEGPNWAADLNRGQGIQTIKTSLGGCREYKGKGESILIML